MDIDDFCNLFELYPSDIELWFDETWVKLTDKLEVVENSMPKARGGIISASATANMLKFMTASDELIISAQRSAAAQALLAKACKRITIPPSIGMKVMRPQHLTITNPTS